MLKTTTLIVLGMLTPGLGMAIAFICLSLIMRNV